MVSCPWCNSKVYQSFPLSKFVNKQSRILREFSDHVTVNFCQNQKCAQKECFYTCNGECSNTIKFIKNKGSFISKRTIGCHLQKHHLIGKNQAQPDDVIVHDFQFPQSNSTMINDYSDNLGFTTY